MIINGDKIIVFIWVRNNVNLNGIMRRLIFIVVLSNKNNISGNFVIEKYFCSVLYCMKECMCVIFGGKCFYIWNIFECM